MVTFEFYLLTERMLLFKTTVIFFMFQKTTFLFSGCSTVQYIICLMAAYVLYPNIQLFPRIQVPQLLCTVSKPQL
jgi:hypothetical protein